MSQLLTAAPAQPATSEEGGEGGGRRRTVLVAAGLVVLLALAAWFLLLRGDSATPTPTTPAGAPATVPTVPAVPAGPAEVPQPEPTPEVVAGELPAPSLGGSPRNPFEAQLVVATPTTSPSASSSPASEPSALPWLLPAPISVLPPSATPAPTTPAASPTPTASPSAAPTVEVALVGVDGSNESAVLTVGGTELRAEVGEEFGERFVLVRLEGGSCATVQHADDGFTDMCEGDVRRL